MSTRPRLETTILAAVDVADQPNCRFLFLIDTAAGGRQAFAVDGYAVEEGVVTGIRRRWGMDVGRHETDVIVAVPVAASWTVLSRDVVHLNTVEQSMRARKEGDAVQGALMEELYPQQVDEPEKPTGRADLAGLTGMHL